VNEKTSALRFRARPRNTDVAALRRLVAGTDAFSAEERATASELLEERLAQGARSGYWFFFAEQGDELLGYCAFGPIPLTAASYDLYWIATAQRAEGRGIGRRLLELAEEDVARRGGGQMFIETSARAAYGRTRRFYRAAGYRQAARLRDFYAAADDKIVFAKVIAPRD
jgi:ribosomal protein S18 acetylase RimI-like enzyme